MAAALGKPFGVFISFATDRLGDYHPAEIKNDVCALHCAAMLLLFEMFVCC
jgi:hypothetical protein